MSDETKFFMALRSTRHRVACATAGEEIKSRMNSTTRFASLFGDAQGSTDMSKRLAFSHCDFNFMQLTEDLFDGVRKTWHAAFLSARS